PRATERRRQWRNGCAGAQHAIAEVWGDDRDRTPERPSMRAPVVNVQNLVKWYGPRLAVRDVSFSVAEGEVVGLLGPNGSGKSTIFRILTGYLAPSSGLVEVAGHDVVTDSLAVRQAISYVPEDEQLYDHMR